MGYREDNKYVIYPLYFDASVSRTEGRRISKELSIEKPSLDAIQKVAKNLGFNPIVEEKCSHPRRHWKHEGRILIDKKDTKEKMIAQIAKSL